MNNDLEQDREWSS